MGKLMRACAFVLTFWTMGIGIPLAIAEISVQNSDAETLGILSGIDQNEIQEAQLAEQKNINSQVLDYARMLDKEHNKHLDQTRQLAQALGLVIGNNASLDHLRTQGAQDLAVLTPLNGSAFVQLYLADIIKGHSEALNWIESQDASDGDVKKFLQETRNDMTMHFKKAQNLQAHQTAGQT